MSSLRREGRMWGGRKDNTQMRETDKEKKIRKEGGRREEKNEKWPAQHICYLPMCNTYCLIFSAFNLFSLLSSGLLHEYNIWRSYPCAFSLPAPLGSLLHIFLPTSCSLCLLPPLPLSHLLCFYNAEFSWCCPYAHGQGLSSSTWTSYHGSCCKKTYTPSLCSHRLPKTHQRILFKL